MTVHHSTVRVMKEGRITIPVDIREFEDIKEGDYLKISIEKIKKEENNENKIKIPYKFKDNNI